MNYELEVLQKRLNDFHTSHNKKSCRDALIRILELSTKGASVSCLFGSVLKLYVSNDVVVKKLIFLYIKMVCSNSSEVSFLISNTLLQDSKSSNPMVRGLSLKISSVLPTLSDTCFQILPPALEDTSSFVRRIAVNACTRLKDTDIIQDEDRIDQLYATIRDPDPVVVVNAILSVNEILKEEGGIIITSKMCQYLVTLLPSLTDTGQVYVLNILKLYALKTADECMFCINALDPILESSNCSVVFAAMDLFVHFTHKLLPNLGTELKKRVKNRLVTFISPLKPERTFILLEKITPLVETSNFLNINFKSFFCCFKDPTYLKVKKIKLLVSLADSDNWKEIVMEIEDHCFTGTYILNEVAIKSLSCIFQRITPARDLCIDRLLNILLIEDDTILYYALSVIQSLSLDVERMKEILEGAIACKQYLVSDASKAAFVAVLGNLGSQYKNSIYIIEDYFDALTDSSTTELKISILSAAVKLFMVRPAEMQHCLGKILALCHDDPCPQIAFKARFYHSLLSCDKQSMSFIIFGHEISS